MQTRKRDIILKFSGGDVSRLVSSVKVVQTQNSFPLGSCLSSDNIKHRQFVRFFTENFNWAVFENELKWEYTEKEEGRLKYRDADELLDFVERNNIPTRGHCIFWEVEEYNPSWIKSLDNDRLRRAIEKRLGVVTKYKGRFKHYDVNNEMLHGSFYRERLGRDIWVDMFKRAHELDQSAILFTNEYDVENGRDAKSCPQKYYDLIEYLRQKEAPIGGISLQGHAHSPPMGPIIYSALDKLAKFDLPIWFTEIDVCSINEHVRAEDLEVMLREAFAHPSVEGILFWGFWELKMFRLNSHFVNGEGDLNEAGKLFRKLKKEWLSRAEGNVDRRGEFKFRGFQGNYEVKVVIGKEEVSKKFVVEQGNDPVTVFITL